MANPSPKVSIETKYVFPITLSAYLVDFVYNVGTTASTITVPLLDTFNSFLVQNKLYRYERRPASFVGPLYFTFDI